MRLERTQPLFESLVQAKEPQQEVFIIVQGKHAGHEIGEGGNLMQPLVIDLGQPPE